MPAKAVVAQAGRYDESKRLLRNTAGKIFHTAVRRIKKVRTQ
ncbi:unknown [Prevotella sp. CAG:1058]|nr:unknown [Prevotella sp. CAG:1058]